MLRKKNRPILTYYQEKTSISSFKRNYMRIHTNEEQALLYLYEQAHKINKDLEYSDNVWSLFYGEFGINVDGCLYYARRLTYKESIIFKKYDGQTEYDYANIRLVKPTNGSMS